MHLLNNSENIVDFAVAVLVFHRKNGIGSFGFSELLVKLSILMYMTSLSIDVSYVLFLILFMHFWKLLTFFVQRDNPDLSKQDIEAAAQSIRNTFKCVHTVTIYLK